KKQLAVILEKSDEYIHLMTTIVTHTLLNQIYKHADEFILLSNIYTQENSATRLTRSAQRTADFLDTHTLEEIAEKRRLKLNTIYDHVVEISLNDVHFPLDRFVPLFVQVKLNKARKKSQSWKLKEIKANLPEE